MTRRAWLRYAELFVQMGALNVARFCIEEAERAVL